MTTARRRHTSIVLAVSAVGWLKAAPVTPDEIAEQGRVDLDAPPRRYLPYFQPADPRAENVTVRQLLAHVSGLQKDDDTRFDNPEFDDGALERLVRESVTRPLDFAPGEKFGYSNLGYCVLGDIVAKVSGETFEAYVKQHILEPLQMKSSTLVLSETKRGPWARPHVVDDTYAVVPASHYPYSRRRAPSNAMSSTLHDMSAGRSFTEMGGSSRAGAS